MHISKSINFWSRDIRVRSTATGPALPRLGGRLVVILERHSPPRGSLERYGREQRRLEHLGGLCSRLARSADAAGPLLPPACRRVHPAAARPWPGHPSPESPARHAPPCPAWAAGDGPRPMAAGRLWRLTAGSPTGPWARGLAMIRLCRRSMTSTFISVK